MNLRLLTLSAAASAVLIAATPMVPASMSTDNGGTKSAIDAYSDGGGVVIINQAGDTKVNNSTMNSLVFKYGEAAKTSSATLKNQINVLSPEATIQEKASAAASLEIAKTIITPPADGVACNDTNAQTINDKYTSGICAGILVPNGSSCDDGNVATSGEKWLNGVCQGGVAGNVAGNGLIYDNCEGGLLRWGEATSYCASKGSGWRLPTLNETHKGTSGANGVPQCPSTTWTWTSTLFNYGYYAWTATTVDLFTYTGTPYGVRCVK